MCRTAREKQEYLLLLHEKLPTHRAVIVIVVRGDWYRHYFYALNGQAAEWLYCCSLGVRRDSCGWESVCTMMLHPLLFFEKVLYSQYEVACKGNRLVSQHVFVIRKSREVHQHIRVRG